MATTNWQRHDGTNHYLEQVRWAIPFGPEQTKLMLQVIGHFTPAPKKILDLGCGNGFLAEILLRLHPDATAVLVDHSMPMIERAYIHMKDYLDRCQIIHGDFSDSFQAYAEPESVDCVVSGYAIHHLPNEKKKKLYKEIYDALTPGGIFINMEHTASATPEIEKLYDELFIDHLSAFNKKDRRQVANEYYSRPDKVDNILERTDVQVEWLWEIGFTHCDCFFKWMELAVFGGVKK
ncbi:Ubiquinone/menaquinone biosynthesis C-methylase UbiE [Evansella caseinilytica]|uniref:Ubiquinone/menaquinone biosynthesis C-methylase UbiE n=1 Tax=Evansella caseinilytica TaxID=1503961 RepID=A0A1H3I7H2_9BACI|nr:class I SAM-dependent methyltransferase [Evansella caseinilytica]SDY23592.1 Ubiquinone/menaquinone biosynthesis C-methylase UbiE [Evansella caseinilytica]